MCLVLNYLKKKTNKNNMTSLPSCGYIMLTSPQDTFDFNLKISDGNVTILVKCHKAVLRSHSSLFRQEIYGENYFQLFLNVQPGCLAATIELIQYMYLKNPDLINSDSKLIAKQAGFLKMSMDYFPLLKNRTSLKTTIQDTNLICLNPVFMTKCLNNYNSNSKLIKNNEKVKLRKKRRLQKHLTTMRTRKRTRSNKVYG
jgi:hypothetical protein